MSTANNQRIDLESYESVVSALERSFSRFNQNPMFSSMGKTLSYADMDKLSAEFASYLQHHTNLATGDRVAIQLPNLLQYPIAVYGALRAGMIVVNTNPMYTSREMLHQFNDAGVKALVALSDLLPAIEDIIAETGIEKVIATSATDLLRAQSLADTSAASTVGFMEALELGSQTPFQPLTKTHVDIALLQYTGGTTGVSKGAMLTHGNLVANTLQGQAILEEHFCEGEATHVMPLPVYHIYAFTIALLMLPYGGHQVVLIPNPRDLDAFITEIKRHDFSGFTGLNTLFVGLCHHEGFKALDFSHLKLTTSGGMALNNDTFSLWQTVTGCTITEAYGLTETSPLACFNPKDAIQIGTVGKPCPATELKTIDASGTEQPDGSPGELCIRGPQVMKGYWQRPEATAEVISEDGWLRTGDVAVIQDDGYAKIVDRMKDMVIVSGFNVFPNEVEDVAMLCPGVLECAVIGVDDEKSGQAVKLFVVAEDSKLSKATVEAFCRDNLTAYKVPKIIEFRDALPKSNVGKILRRELR